MRFLPIVVALVLPLIGAMPAWAQSQAKSLDGTIQVTLPAGWVVSDATDRDVDQLTLNHEGLSASAHIDTWPLADSDADLKLFIKFRQDQFIARHHIDGTPITKEIKPTIEWTAHWSQGEDHWVDIITFGQTAHYLFEVIAQSPLDKSIAAAPGERAIAASVRESRPGLFDPPPETHTVPASSATRLAWNVSTDWLSDPDPAARGPQLGLVDPKIHGVATLLAYLPGSFTDLQEFAQASRDSLHSFYPSSKLSDITSIKIGDVPALQWDAQFTDAAHLKWAQVVTVFALPHNLVECREMAPQSLFAAHRDALVKMVSGIHPVEAFPSQSVKKISGLVVRMTSDGSYHGGCIEIIAAPSDRAGGTMARSIERVGDEMQIALDEAGRLAMAHHPGARQRIDISFGDKYTAKDGGSAGTAFSLLLLSALGDFEINPDAAITGDITVDGMVRQVGEVPAKVHGAALDHRTLVVIPETNVQDMAKAALLDGPGVLFETQIFSARTIDQAAAIIRADPNPNIPEAMAEFDAFKAVYENASPVLQKSPAALQKLAAILKLAPNHVSAGLLAQMLTGKGPTHLSAVETIAGAMKAMGRMQPALSSIDSRGANLEASDATPQEVQAAHRRLEAVRRVAAPNAAPAISAMAMFADAYQEWGHAFETGQTDAERLPLLNQMIDAHNAWVRALHNVISDPAAVDSLLHGQ